jgi:peptidyl-prolyl cis-trans isomerase SurA
MILKKVFSVICRFALALAIAQSAWAAAADEPNETLIIDRVVAVVGAEPVTEGEVRRFIKVRGGKMPAEFGPGNKAAEVAIRDFLTTRLIELEAQGQGVSILTKEVDAYVGEIMRQNGIDEKGLFALLKSQGSTLEQYRTQIRHDILQARILNLNVRNKINIVEEDVDRYLADHMDRVPEEGKVKVEQYTVVFEGGIDSTGEMTKIREMLINGELGALPDNVRRLNLGYVSLDDLKRIFREGLKELKVGEITQPLRDANGHHLLVLRDKQEEGEGADEAVRAAVKQELLEMRYRNSVEQYLSKTLPDKYGVEVKL